MAYRDPKTGRWASPPVLVFVYGTLKRDYRNHYILFEERAEFVGYAKTAGSYRMYQRGFPVLMEDGDGHRVSGELYRTRASAIPRLDRLEGEGRIYDRKITHVSLTDSSVECSSIECSIYVGRPDFWDRQFKDQEPMPLNGDGLHAWPAPYEDEAEVVEPEDQSQGDLEGVHDERERP